MIISKTPVRVSFFGGGTDYPDYFKDFPGGVLSSTIDQYIYITINKIKGLLDHKYRIAYSKLETVNDVDDIQHERVREAIKLLQIKDGLEINIISDLPARTGLGSSSCFTVGLLNALYAYKGEMKSKEHLAKEAIFIERDILGERVGVQDQLAGAYGGLNIMHFTPTQLSVRPISIEVDRKKALQSRLMMFLTGVDRSASDVLQEQLEKTQEKTIQKELKDIYNMVDEGLAILTDHNQNLDLFGALMHRAWETKRSLSSKISNGHLDSIYQKAIEAGAIGGKLLGAGGGGFFLFYVPLDAKEQVRKALSDQKEIVFQLEDEGTRIVKI